MQKLAPLGSGGFVDGCGEFSFFLDVLMVKVAYYIDFALIASYFQNSEQKNVGNVESKQRFWKSAYNNHVYMMEMAF